MQFAQPQFLYGLWLLPLLLILLVWSYFERRRALKRFAGQSFWEKLVVGTSVARQWLKSLLLLLFVGFVVLALARPQWGTRMETARRSGIDVMVVLDCSASMDTRDVAPSRMEKAKHEIQLLLEALKGDRAGLILFAGTPVVNCPLTIDENAVKMFLEIVDTQIVPQPGTNIGAAIRLAVNSFGQTAGEQKLILLVTDGESLEGDPLEAAADAKRASVLVYTLGVGTGAGEPIPLRDEKEKVSGYKKDESGNVVVSRLDETMLEQIASSTGGKYYRATSGEEEVNKMAGAISQMDRRQWQSQVYVSYLERFQYPLVIAFGLIFCEMILSDQKSKRIGANWILGRE